MNPQIKAILLCAVGIILLALVCIPGGSVWEVLHKFLFGLFGVCALLVPVIFIYMGIMTAKEKVMEHKGVKIVLSLTVLIMTCTLFYILSATNYNKDHGYFSAVGAAFQGSFETRSLCGLTGAILGYPFKEWFTDVPAVIICLVVLAVSIMILTRVTLLDIARVAKKGYQRHVERRQRRRPDPIETNDNAYELPEVVDNGYRPTRSSSDRIDIPLDKPKRKQRQKDQQEIEDEQRDENILNIIQNANSGMVPDQELDASAVAKRITKNKSSHTVAEGAKQADPQTVQVDIGEETRRMGDAVKKEEAKSADKPQYVFPPTKLLDPSIDAEGSSAYNEMQENATKLVETLKSFGVKASITNICRGPSVTRYELKPEAGVKISKITNLSDDIALNLAANGVRIEAPIPGKAAVGIEVPNPKKQE